MSDALATIYSRSDAFKRKLIDALRNPRDALNQHVNNLNDNARAFNDRHAAATDEFRQTGEFGGPKQMAMTMELAESYNPVGMIVAGKPFTFIRNTGKSPNLGEQFGQHIEPAGRYMLEDTAGVAKKLPPGWESGEMTFQNPRFIEWGSGGYSDPDNWKQVLMNEYGGKTGKKLSQAMAKRGHDAVVTLRDGETSEIVDLSSFVNALRKRKPE